MAKIIRRPDRAGGGLTDDERTKMAAHAQLWIARAMRTEPIQPAKIVPAIEGLYDTAGLKRPRVVIVPSPLVMAMAGGISAAGWHLRKSGAKNIRAATAAATDTAVRAATAAATDAATYSATFAATAAATDTAVRAATYAATAAATDAATAAATDTAVRAATREDTRDDTDFRKIAAAVVGEEHADFAIQCATRWVQCYQGGNMWSAYDCYLTAARDVLGLRLPQHEKYAAWEQASIEGGPRWAHDEFCMVSDFPEILRKDEQNRPHCADGPSHRWRDGWALYHWRGVRVPAEWIEDKASLTAAVALSQENIEKRRAACEILGWDRILAELNAKTIHADEDPTIGTLLEVELDGRHERFLRVLCGTGRTFAIPVPPEMTTALEANAWSYAYDDVGKFIKPEIRT